MIAQCDPDGNEYLLFETFVNYRTTDDVMSLEEQIFTDKNGRACRRRSTAGWQLCCCWKDGSTSWQDLSDIKEAYPLQTAEFAVSQELDHEPVFN
jgi:hypothetical protein